jgi:hypothetical protein
LAAPRITVYPFGRLAQITSTWKVVAAPLAFLMSPFHVLPDGNELPTLARVLDDETMAPPPSGTVPVGHRTVPRVSAPSGAASSGEMTTRYRAGGRGVPAVLAASSTPAIDNLWVADGAHVISVGACRPTQREMDPALVTRSRLFVDSRAAAVKESGDVIAAGRTPRQLAETLTKASETCRHNFHGAFLELLVDRLSMANLRLSQLLTDRNVSVF